MYIYVEHFMYIYYSCSIYNKTYIDKGMGIVIII